jgi:hypothetical protein
LEGYLSYNPNNPNGSTTAANSAPVTIATDDGLQAKLGIVTETAPASDTASSGLNGRLQRIAQRITSLIAQLPASLGIKTAANSLSVTLASDQATVPVSLATNTPTIAAGTAIIGKVGIDQTTPGTTNLVSLAANQSVNTAQVNGVTPLMGNGVTGTGSQRVTIASDNTAFPVNATLQTGANVIGSLTANQSVNNAQIAGVTTATGNGVVGTGVQRVAIASDNTAFSVNATLAAETTKVIGTVNVAASQTIAVTQATAANLNATVTPIALTKATQGATGFSTQDLKDAGRVIINVATAIGGVTAVTTEALLALNVSKDGAATSSITTIPVTSGKRLRVQAIVASVRSTSAAVLSGRVCLRMNPSGTVTASSPIIAMASMTQQAAALAEGGDTCVIPIPDGIEFSGTMQFGLSQVCSAITGVVYASIICYEY